MVEDGKAGMHGIVHYFIKGRGIDGIGDFGQNH